MTASRMIRSSDVLGRNFSACAIGDSLTAASANGNSYYNKLIRRSGGAIRDRGNFSVAGKRSDEIISVQVPQAIASGAQSCFCLMGTNNIIQGGAFITTLRTDVASCVTTLRAAGVEPIFCLLPPTNTSANVPATVAFNVWLTLYCMYNNITLIDAWTLLATAAGGYQSGLNVDAIHWNTVGADLIASAALTQIRTGFNCLPLLAFTDTGSDAGGFIGNAISMTDSNADGIPDSWFSLGSGGTYTIQNSDANAFGKWFRCAISAAGSNVGFNATSTTLASLGWNSGDTLIVGCNIRWVDSSQALLQNMNVIGITTSSNQPIFQEKGGSTGDSYTVYGELLITGGTTVNIQPFATGTGYFEMNRPIIVNKTKLGF